MLLSERDVAVLQLLRWCRFIHPGDLLTVFTEAEVANLTLAGFIKKHSKSGALTLAGKGAALLAEICCGDIPTVAQSYHGYAIQRRLRLSKLMITAYRAGADVFTMTPETLSASPSLFLSSMTRGRGTNPWGSTRIAALARLGDLLCGCYFLYGGVGKLSLTDELTALSSQTSRIEGVSRGLIFAGENYQTILAELEAPASQKDTKLLSYGDAYRCVRLPVYLLSCDETGAMQLQIMAVQDYRRKLTQAALKTQYQPPPSEVPSWDALFDGAPFVMAADMDMHRVEAALEAASTSGYVQIVLACLEEQAKAAFIPRYRDCGKVRFFGLKEETLAQVLGHLPKPYDPPRTQYLTKEGGVIDAPIIQAAGKVGKAGRKAGGRR